MARESKSELSSPQGKGSKPPEARSIKQRLYKRLPPDRKAAAVNLLLIVGLGVIASWLLAPELFSTRQPYDHDASSIGRISQKVIKANRDYDIPDDETTARKRLEARDAVLPVYDEDLSVSKAALDRVNGAFELMRAALAKVDSQAQQAEAAREAERSRQAESKGREAQADEASGKVGAVLKPLPEVPNREALYRETLFGLRESWRQQLQLHIDDEYFEALVGDRFSRESQEVVLELIRRAYTQGVTENREALAIAAKNGITMRKRDGATHLREILVRDVSAIREFSEIPQEAERWMSESGRDLSKMSPLLRQGLLNIATRQVRINVIYNAQETEGRRRHAGDSVKPVVIQLKKGEKIIGDGEKFESRHINIFASINQQAGGQDLAATRFGSALFAIALIIVVHCFALRSLRRYRPTVRDKLFLALTLVTMLFVARMVFAIGDGMQDHFADISPEALYYLAPFAAGAMLVRFILTAEAALVFSIVFAGLAGIASGSSLSLSLYALVGSLVACNRVARANDRVALFKAGLWTGAVNAGFVVILSLLSSKMGVQEAVVSASVALIGGAVLVPMLVIGLTPLIEALFGYTTDIKLLELANLNHPALKELILQAPGTYHHSIIIGSLVEAAAEAIGAIPLLARVCAYYHDIGKGRNPLYFAENQRGDNKHNKLAPQMSALIIKRHVTDGLELARHYKLPAPVAAAIPQHHGTRVISYFYSKAVADQEGKADPQPVDQSLYCYPGPKPQSRETALVMIADVVEASSRAMQNPTPAKLQALVQSVINGVFSDGQLDECDLTLRDLNEIGKAFFQVLGGIYHSRPEYPAQALSCTRTQLTESKDVKELAASKEETPREAALITPAEVKAVDAKSPETSRSQTASGSDAHGGERQGGKSIG
ncbi:MAG: HDIG domain-containing protein [Myxococcaceae bacterium]|nr:HDIG domain-containing protein [Myxococcaceae bacterium]